MANRVKRNVQNKRGKGNYKGKGSENRPQRNSRASESEVSFEGRKEEPINKTPWYVRSKSTQQAVERISFNNVLGEPYPIQGENQLGSGTSKTVWKKAQFPTFMTIYVNPSLEPSSMGSAARASKSAINRSSAIEYVMWSSVSGRTQNYTAADIGVYKLAIGSIMGLISHIRRGLGLCRYYSQRNLTYPKEVMGAMGYDISDLSQRLVLTYIDQLNYEIRLLNSMKFPKNLQYFEKWSSIFDNVYKDSESQFSQDFAFIPYSLWKLDEAYNEAGSGLRTLDICSTGSKTFTWYLNTLDVMINEVMASSTQQLIGSDMLNYARKESYELGGVPELAYDYIVTPVYSAEACIHLHHVRPTGAPISDHKDPNATDKNDVAPITFGSAATLYLAYKPHFPYSKAVQLDSLIDLKTENPTIDEIVEARRYMAYIGGPKQTAGDLTTDLAVLNDAYAVAVNVYGIKQGEFKYLTTIDNNNNMFDSTSATQMMCFSSFNHAPIMPYDAGGTDEIYYFGEVENIADVPYSYAQRVTHLEQLDLFTTAEMERYIKDMD